MHIDALAVNLCLQSCQAQQPRFQNESGCTGSQAVAVYSQTWLSWRPPEEPRKDPTKILTLCLSAGFQVCAARMQPVQPAG